MMKKAVAVSLFTLVIPSLFLYGADPGTVKWTAVGRGAAIAGLAMAEDGTLYTTSQYSGRLSAIGPDGTLKWEHYFNGGYWQSLTSPAVGPDGTVFLFADETNELWAVHADGTVKWSVALGDTRATSPAIGADGALYYGVHFWGNSRLLSLNPDGSTRWSEDVSCMPDVSPSIGPDGRIFFACKDDFTASGPGAVYAVNPNGEIEWTFPVPSHPVAPVSIGDDGMIHVPTSSGVVWILNAGGDAVGQYDAGSRIQGSVAIADDGALFFGDQSGTLHAVEPDGSLRWTYPTTTYLRGTPALGDDGAVFVICDDRRLHAVNPDGSPRWEVSIYGLRRTDAIIADDGTVYVGGEDGYNHPVVYAINTDLEGPATAPWPMGGQNVNRTGRRRPVDMPPVELELDLPYESTLPGGELHHFTIETDAGRNLLIELQTEGGIQTAVLDASYGGRPDPGSGRWSTVETTARGFHELLVTPTEDSTAAISVLATWVTGAGSYTLTAQYAESHLSDVMPRFGGNLGQVSTQIRGLGFDDGVSVALEGPGLPNHEADEVTVGSASDLAARFDLAGAPHGVYDVVARWPGGATEVLPSAFEITPGLGPKPETSLELPVATRPGRRYFGWIDYGNNGDTDMPAPLLVVTSPQDPPMRLSPQDPYTRGGLQVLGISHGHNAGVLGPGEHYRIPIQFIAPFSAGVTFEVDQVLADTTVIDWPAVEAEIQSPDMSNELWSAAWSNFTATVGTTWADYVHALGEMATYQGRHGRHIHDASVLFGALFARAAGSYLGETLDAALDAYAPARGLPLVFARVSPGGLASRFTAGPLGRGWGHGYGYRLEQTAADRVTLHLPGGSTRSFFLEDGSWRGGAGEHAVLSDTGGGAFALVEPSGVALHFDASDRLVSIDEPNGNAVTLGYVGDRLETLTHSNGQVLTLEYNGDGRIQYLTDHADRLTEYVYDPTGELLESVIAPGGVTTQYAYRPDSDDARAFALETITHPDGTHTYFDYDSEGRLSATRLDGDEETVTLAYDHLGTVTATDELGHKRTLRIGANGEILESVNPLGERHRFTYDERLDLRRIEQPDGTAALIDYDTRGNPIAVTSPGRSTVRMASTTTPVRMDWFSDALEQTLDFDYDNGNPVAVNYPDQSVESFTYDPANGDLETATNRRGDTVTLDHNLLGELTDVDHPDGTWVDLGHDAVARTWTFTDAVGTTTIDYDERGMLETVTDAAGRTLTSTVNDAGRRTRMETGDGYVLDYGYDAAGRLSTITDGDGFEIVRYEWDDAGRLEREDRGNGTYSVSTYDAADRLLSLTHHAPGGAVQSFFAYTYDAVGNPVTLTTTAGVTEFDYDGDGQLETITRPDATEVIFTYDAAGNRELKSDDGTETVYEANEINQYTDVGSAILSYDHDGNLETVTDGGGTTTLEWNAASRLQTLSSPTAGAWSFRDDATGNRVEVVHDGVGRHYQHDPRGLDDVVAEYDDEGDLTARYIHGLGLAARRDAAGNYAWYGFDGTGNTRQLTDASGAVVSSYDYTPFGVPTAIVETVLNPFRYGGRDGVMDDGHGLIFMRARYYDPQTGRFVSPDPIGLNGGHHLYDYTGNSPIGFSDPSGLTKGHKLSEGKKRFRRAYYNRIWAFAQINLDNPKESLEAYTGTWKEFGEASTHAAVQIYATDLPGAWSASAKPVDFKKPQSLLGRAWYIIKNAIKGHDDTRDNLLEPPGQQVRPPRSDLPSQSSSSGTTQVIFPRDPNEKAGPPGLGPDRVVRTGQELDYTVYFENVPTATAAAQEVFVTDCLDRNLDWTTLEVDEVVFGDHTVTNAGGGAVFTQRVTVADLREDNDSTWWVDVSSTIDLSTGCLDVSLEMRDPETGELPMDVFAGFLPPDDGEGSGQGHFNYSVEVKEGLDDGRLVRNRAEIVFDTNDAIWTNEVINMVGPQLYTLTITPAGNGAGTVTSDPAGVACGAECVGWFAESTVLVLTAMPAEKSLFAGWSGDADCNDGEVALEADTECIATFVIDTAVFSDGFETGGLEAWSLQVSEE